MRQLGNKVEEDERQLKDRFVAQWLMINSTPQLLCDIRFDW